MRGPRSLQLRLALALGLTVTVLWLLAASFTARLFGQEMEEIADRALVEAAQRILPLAARDQRNHPDDDDRETRVDRLNQQNEYLSYVVRTRDGRMILHSDDPTAVTLPATPLSGFSDTETSRLFTERADDLVIVVAEPLAHRRELARETQLGLALPLVVVIPLTLLAIFLAVRQSLGPVRRLRRDLAHRGPNNLAPLPDHGLPTELAPIAKGVNLLLNRLADAFEAERSFAAHAAHELRTPVAGAIAQAQRLRSETRDVQAAERAGEIETTLKRLNGLSVKLMQLARAEGAQLHAPAPTDLRPVLEMVLADFDRNQRGRVHRTLAPGPVLSHLDPDAFGIVARNLIENALRHSAPGTPVEVALSAETGLSVVNDCAAVEPETLARITERFTRASHSVDGAGLGLAIVRTIAERSGGALTLASPAPGRTQGFAARFGLPVA